MKTMVLGLIAAMTLGKVQNANAQNQTQNQVPVVVIAQVKVKVGMEQSFKEAASRILEPSRDEAGNISYEFHQSLEDATEFATYEQWQTVGDLDQHMTLPHMQKFFAEVGSMFEPGYPVIKKFKKFEN